MESEQEIRMSRLHEQLLQSQIGHQTASSHGTEDRHSKKQVCCRPAHFCAGMKSLWSTLWMATLLRHSSKATRKRRAVSSHGEGDSRKRCACEYRVRRSAEGCNSLLRFCTLSRGRSLFSLRERWCQKINVLLYIYM